ncbi:uncharacterized protein GGS22DRAFT_187086 [Annulohypoxylon maeteangense]|uniref:uncharacterized protein n=1 Tax=Annulohypoxylon maeteangense TaxID=1927788 RepID=UPI0020075DCA|nr:uncharacterized protein GGS22DRAFT_187086 [Annulohypoxylon maeteangense]KAI0887007.1 hypothetical protein GGS22DRAFT_187086 [Annulohypoxylon maeteangense]
MIFSTAAGLEGSHNKTNVKPTGYIPIHKRPRDPLTNARARAETISREVSTSTPSRLSAESIIRDSQELAKQPVVQTLTRQFYDGEADQIKPSATPLDEEAALESTQHRSLHWTTLATRRQQAPEKSNTHLADWAAFETVPVYKKQRANDEPESPLGTGSITHFVALDSTSTPSTRPDDWSGHTVMEVNPPIQTILSVPSAPGLALNNIATILIGVLIGAVIIVSAGFMCWFGRLLRIRNKEKEKKEEQRKNGGGAAAGDPEAGQGSSTNGHHGTHTQFASSGTAGTRGSRGARGAAGATGASATSSGGSAGDASMGGMGH